MLAIALLMRSCARHYTAVITITVADARRYPAVDAILCSR